MANNIRLGIDVTVNNQQAKKAFSELQTSLQNLISQGSRGDFGINWQKGMQGAVQSAKELQVHLNRAFNQKTGQLELDRLNLSLKSSGQTITQYSQALLQGGKLGQEAFRNLSTQIVNTQAPTARLTDLVGELATTFKTALKYQISYGAINAVTNGIREAVGYAKELNKTTNDIRIVTGKSADEADRLARNAQNAAKGLKTSAKDLLQAQLIYFQQGDSDALSAKKGEITTKAAQVARVEAQQMSEYLTAVWNSYKVGSGELELFVDKLAAVGAATATSLEEISTAMTKVAATANTVGVSYDQLTATIATISSVTRTAPETVGTALKTIYARMGDLKLGKEDEDGLELGDVSSTLDQVGVKILDTNNDLRDMGIVVEEVGNKWQGWTKAQQTAIAQAIAGKRQYTQLMALFENWDMYTETKGVSEDALGALEEQHKIWSESWEAASERVKVATEGVYSNLINDDVMIKFTDSIAFITEGIGGILDGLGGIPGILMLITTYLLRVKGVAIEETFREFGRTMQLTIGGQGVQAAVDLKQALLDLNTIGMKNLSQETLDYINRLKQVLPIQIEFDKNAKNMTEEQKRQVQSLMETANALDDVAAGYRRTANEAKASSRASISRMMGKDNYQANRSIIDQAVTHETIASAGRQFFQQNFSGLGLKKLLSGKEFAAEGAYVQQYSEEVRALSQNQSQLQNLLKTTKHVLSETSPAYKKLSQAIKENKVDEDMLKEVLRQVSLEVNHQSSAAEQLVKSLTLQKGSYKDLIQRLREEAEARGIAISMAEIHEEVLKQIEQQIRQSTATWTQSISMITNLSMNFTMLASSVNTLIDSFKNGEVSITSIMSLITSIGFVASSTIIPAITNIMKYGKAVKTQMDAAALSALKLQASLGWISIIATLAVSIGILVYNTVDWRSEEEKLNDELEKTNERIHELKNSTNEYNSAIEELREKQKTANAAQYAELEREIRLKESLMALDKEALTLEEEKEKELRQQKAQNWINDNSGLRSGSGDFSYKLYVRNSIGDNTRELTSEEYAQLSQEQKRYFENLTTGASRAFSDARFADGTPLADIFGKEYEHIVKQDNFNAEKELAEYKTYIKDIEELEKKTNKSTADYTEIINLQNKANLERIEILKTYSEVLSNSQTKEQKAQARNIIAGKLTTINNVDGVTGLNEMESHGLFSDLYKVDPEAFDSINAFKQAYKDIIPPETMSLVEKFWEKFQIDAQNTVKEIENVKKATEILVKGVDGIRKAQNEVKEQGGWLDVTTIEETIKSMTGLGDATEYYRGLLYGANGDIEAVTSVLQAMTQANFEGMISSGQLANATQEQIEAMLREAGVVNASEAALEMYAKAQLQAAAASLKLGATKDDVQTAIDTFIQKFNLTGDAAKNATQGLLNFYIQQKILSNSELDLSQQINELKKFLAVVGIAEEQAYGALFGTNYKQVKIEDRGGGFSKTSVDRILNLVNKDEKNLKLKLQWIDSEGNKITGTIEDFLKNALNNIQSELNGANLETFIHINPEKESEEERNKKIRQYEEDLADLRKERDDLDKQYQKDIADLEEERIEAENDYNERYAELQKNLAEAEADYVKKLAELAKDESLELLEESIEKYKALIDEFKEDIDISDWGSSFVEDNDWTNKMDLASLKIQSLTSYGQKMKDEFNRLSQTIPKTGKEAQAIASRLQELGKAMRDNVSNLRETNKELQLIKVNVIATTVQNKTQALQKELDKINSYIEILNSDYGEDYHRVSTEMMFSVNLLPMGSEEEAKLQEKQRIDAEIIAEERQTQETINQIVKDALAQEARDNAAARAEERAELAKDLAERKEAITKQLADLEKEYEKTKKKNKERLEEIEKDYEESREKINKKINSLETEYKNYLNNIKNETKNAVNNIQQTWNGIELKKIEFNIAMDTLLADIKSVKEQVDKDLNEYWNVEKIDWNGKQVTRSEVPFLEIASSHIIGKWVENAQKPGGDDVVPIDPSTEDLDAGFDYVNKTVLGGKGLRLSSPYGYRTHPVTGEKNTLHNGVDIPATAGTAVRSPAKGIVTKISFNDKSGNYIHVLHENGYITSYAHLLDGSISVEVGQSVEAGQRLAGVGSTGESSTGNHLHYRIIPPSGGSIDPLKFKFATGTPLGNIQAHNLGIAGENYKPEILIDKATGEKTYIDKPTVIDTSKTDVVGEKQTARLPLFAEGTLTPEEIARYIRKTYPEITDAGIAAILANIQKESSFDPQASIVERYGSGRNDPTLRTGLFQIDDDRYPGWSDIVKYGTWQQQIDAAIAEGRYKNSGMGNNKNYNVWERILTNPNLTASEAAKEFDRLFERSSGGTRAARGELATDFFNRMASLLGENATYNIDVNINTEATPTSNSGTEAESDYVDIPYYSTPEEIAELAKSVHAIGYFTNRPTPVEVTNPEDIASEVTNPGDVSGEQQNQTETSTTTDNVNSILEELAGFKTQEDLNSLIQTIEDDYSVFNTKINEVKTALDTETKAIVSNAELSEEEKTNQLTNLYDGLRDKLEDEIYGFSTDIESLLITYKATTPEEQQNISFVNVIQTLIDNMSNKQNEVQSSLEANLAKFAIDLEKSTATKESPTLDAAQKIESLFKNSYNEAEKKLLLDAYNISQDTTMTAQEKTKSLAQLSREVIGDENSGLLKDLKTFYDQIESILINYIESTPAEQYDPEVVKQIKDILSEMEQNAVNLENFSISTIQNEAKNRYAFSSNWIAEREFYDDWDKFGDDKVAAWTRVLNDFKELYPNEKATIKTLEHNVYTALKEAAQAAYEHSSDWIAEREYHGDWEDFGDNKTAAWMRVYEKALNSNNPDAKDKAEKIKQARHNVIDAVRNSVEYEYNQWKEEIERRQSELEGKKSIYAANYDVKNSVRDAQHEINKELQKSLTLYQYLDEETRKLLFNTEEYFELNKELESIEKEANRLKNRYLVEIQGKTADEISQLTKEYEMQTESLMKQYEIKKAEFDIEKKRLELNNILNERNVRMFIGGSWQWVADTKKIADAQAELAEAEYQKTKLEDELWQERTLNGIQGTIDNLDLEVARAEDAFAELKESLTGEKGLSASVGAAKGAVDTYTRGLITWLEELTGKDYDSNDEESKSSGKDGLGIAKNIDGIVAFFDSNNRFVGSTGFVGPLKKNATGTDNASGGISMVNEKGIEMWATKYGHLVELNPGDKIFNNDQFNFLYKFSRNPEAFQNLSNSSSQSIDNSITIGGIEISKDSPEGEALHSILTRILGNR